MEKGNKISLVLGIIAVLTGIFVFGEAAKFQKNATLTQGKVVHVLGSSYKIQYFNEAGQEFIKQGSGKTHGFRQGADAKVWYRADNPGKARLTDGKKGGKKIIIFGALLLLLGTYPIFLKKKENPQINAS
jgi:hypothetical protein